MPVRVTCRKLLYEIRSAGAAEGKIPDIPYNNAHTNASMQAQAGCRDRRVRSAGSPRHIRLVTRNPAAAGTAADTKPATADDFHEGSP